MGPSPFLFSGPFFPFLVALRRLTLGSRSLTTLALSFRIAPRELLACIIQG